MDNKFTDAEGFTLVGVIISILIAFSVMAFFYKSERTKREDLELKAQKYDVVKPVIEGSDSELLKKVVKALEKSE